MASTYKLKDIESLDLKNGEKKEVGIEDLGDTKLLLVKLDGQVHALTPNCTHYGAPLVKGVLTPDGRITCPWHGACFNVTTGDIEDAPAPNALEKFEVFEKDSAVYVKADAESLKRYRREPISQCSVVGDQKVVIIGGGSAAFGTVEVLRDQGFKGKITIISRESNPPLDRTKLSKALIPDPNKILLRPAQWYSSVGIDLLFDNATAVDFEKKVVSAESGKSFPYTKLVLATGGVPRRLPVPGIKDLGNVFVLRFSTDVQQILEAVGDKNKNIVVIGSSFIGMEVGNCLSKDNKVTIVGMESAPLERVMGKDVGQIFRKLLEKQGVTFHMSTSLDKATPAENDSSKVGAVHLKDGTVLPADLVILGVGVAPATEFLQGNAAVTLEQDGSLKTDESFAVNGLKDVYAVGDIATYPYRGPGAGQGGKTHVRIEHWDVAQNAGRSVGFTLANALASPPKDFRPKPFIPIFWSALGQQLRYCGNTMNGWDDVIITGDPDNFKFAAFYTLGDTIVASASMNMDPLNSKCAELMRRGNMPGKRDLQRGVDILGLDLPGTLKM
ncbi:Apoptosis-inducing factor 1 [Ophidiomyces ophidiicola]|nr:Apoptosis-inducing factor 1 [Ophidiomyces ophidiicola]KAI1914854.1 Apoptosis-inducing factor 1 [Ophidiomyces ophidiicola]KAI1925127.1 Apoptosis-inducing factor 1 [Ophidiomyces ophidiicola]KAI1957467.1 Apoptosis-inducing factor 1 [Ophidiomyces ophidiicola]KAI2005763.1 Apoptosis-inducing factor 1 [Ophidiomyces ophidiicola]